MKCGIVEAHKIWAFALAKAEGFTRSATTAGMWVAQSLEGPKIAGRPEKNG